MLAAEDAEKLTIPHMVLASNGEDAEVVKQYKAIIEGDGKIGDVRDVTARFGPETWTFLSIAVAALVSALTCAAGCLWSFHGF